MAPDTGMGDKGVTHLLSLIKRTMPPLHPGGRPIVLGGLAGTLGLRVLLRMIGLSGTGRIIGRWGLIGTAASAAFFRAPKRVTPAGTDLVVAPADGLVSLIEHAEPPAELGLIPGPRLRVSVFLSVFDVHVQRVPVSGVITQRAYRAGAFLSADLDKASTDNERNSLVITSTSGQEIVVTQIAGSIARRIVCSVDTGNTVTAGDTYGLIRFGSRVDTYLPADAVVRVILGQRTIGGETVIATLGTTPADEDAGAGVRG